ncbi:hypothetical protein PMZ80_008131 [Knufia obscura]|uniref:Uncharacterized protein n=2 Tax=Knufia TaxID=430999 RepID=A0AAN8EJM5_9EURO|nr:hypothetical protein PMZ80_008131 [Knufia obscura]KAK5957144.1 hypothetical protein OHC33_001513 [Knufia fluminis]
METRFKKFITTRRGRSATLADNDLAHQSAPYEASSPALRPPIFLYQPLAKSALELQRDCERDVAAPVRSFSYDQVTPGKAPIFIKSLPQKGNGPIKLQASRRMSSGELITNADDSQRMLQNIRDGDYVVGRKERSLSSSQGRSNTNVNEPRVSRVRSPNHSPLPTPKSPTPTGSQTCPTTPSLVQDSPLSGRLENFEIANPTIGLGLTSPSSVSTSRPSPTQESHDDYRSSFGRQSTSHDSSRSHLSAAQSGNATLQALRKAEYSRLVDIYGADVAARNLARLDHEHLHSSIGPVSPFQLPYSPVIFEPLPAPPADHRDAESGRTSRMSEVSSEWSGASSPQRRSYVSSYAESSSATRQKSIVDDDPAATREDIRNMVEQMRSTYLSAFEQRTPPAARTKPRKKKQRKPKLMTSPALGTPDQHSPRSPPLSGKQTFHADESDSDAPYTRRINSQPVSGTGRLSPIQASPRKNDEHEQGIRRADSATLGGLMAEMKRSRIRASQSSRRQSEQKSAASTPRESNFRPVTPTNLSRVEQKNSWQDFESQGTQHLPPLTPQQPPREEKANSWLNLESDSAEEPFVDSPYDVPRDLHQPRILSQHSVSIDKDQYQSESSVPGYSNSFDTIYDDLFGKNDKDFWSSSSSVGRPPSLTIPALHTDALPTSNHTSSQSTPKKTSHTLSITESPENTHLARTGQMEGNFI